MARHRYDLTGAEWNIIEPLLPNKSRGVKRVDDRRVLNGIFWRMRGARRGPISRSATVLTQPATIASCGGKKLVSGPGFCARFLRPTMVACR